MRAAPGLEPEREVRGLEVAARAVTSSAKAWRRIASWSASRSRSAKASGTYTATPRGSTSRGSRAARSRGSSSSMPGHRGPEPARGRQHLARLLPVRGGVHDGLARASGSSLLKIPEPTNTASAPRLMQSAASAGVAIPPAAKFGTGSLPCSCTKRTRSTGAPSSLARVASSSPRSAWMARMSPFTWRRCRTASTMLPLPASPLVRIMAAPSPIAAQRLAEVARTAHEGRAEAVLVDVMRLVGGRQHLALVDEVHAERVEHLRLDEVADAHLRHHRDRDARWIASITRDLRHARHAALLADVGRHALERHHRGRAGLLGELGLLGRGHVHDHAALQHLGEADLDLVGRRSAPCRWLMRSSFASSGSSRSS